MWPNSLYREGTIFQPGLAIDKSRNILNDWCCRSLKYGEMYINWSIFVYIILCLLQIITQMSSNDYSNHPISSSPCKAAIFFGNITHRL